MCANADTSLSPGIVQSWVALVEPRLEPSGGSNAVLLTQRPGCHDQVAFQKQVFEGIVSVRKESCLISFTKKGARSANRVLPGGERSETRTGSRFRC
jgi:hypothetical protein